MKRILIIEDDPAIARGLQAALVEEHYEVLHAADGQLGEQKARTEKIDLVILDLMLPAKNGIDVCRDLRKDGIAIPILMLTSKKGETDKVLGLEIGADDYVTKPFSIQELKARIKALLRRPAETLKEIETIAFGNIEIEFRKHEARKGKREVLLSSRELAVLKYLAQHEGEVVTREMLLDGVWGYETFPTTRTVDNYILSLRKKLEDDPASPKHIITVHTSGYKFVR
jgi:DNA-binding response OmpR family regulator